MLSLWRFLWFLTTVFICLLFSRASSCSCLASGVLSLNISISFDLQKSMKFCGGPTMSPSLSSEESSSMAVLAIMQGLIGDGV